MYSLFNVYYLAKNVLYFHFYLRSLGELLFLHCLLGDTYIASNLILAHFMLCCGVILCFHAPLLVTGIIVALGKLVLFMRQIVVTHGTPLGIFYLLILIPSLAISLSIVKNISLGKFYKIIILFISERRECLPPLELIIAVDMNCVRVLVTHNIRIIWRCRSNPPPILYWVQNFVWSADLRIWFAL